MSFTMLLEGDSEGRKHFDLSELLVNYCEVVWLLNVRQY